MEKERLIKPKEENKDKSESLLLNYEYDDGVDWET